MKQVLLCLLLGSTLSGNSQVVINIQLPPAGLSVKSQLWNLSLVNTFPQTIMIQVEMVMTDVASGQRVLTGISKPFMLNKGVKLVQISDVMPVSYNTGSSGYPVDANPDGFLPVGVFNICYALLSPNGEVIEKIAEECETVEIEPVSPPQLIVPGDSECVELSRPLFTWLPPSPYTLFNNLIYDWKLVEIQGTQTGADAIQSNIPVLTQRNLTTTNFQYPLSAPVLDTSRLYAWAVTAKSNASPIANSEIWTFRLNCAKEPAVINRPVSYLAVKREEGAAMGVFSGSVSFEYINEINDSTVHLSVSDITGANRRRIDISPEYQKVHFGQNLLQLDLGKNDGMVNKNIYLLELINSKNERWYLKFEFRKAD